MYGRSMEVRRYLVAKNNKLKSLSGNLIHILKCALPVEIYEKRRKIIIFRQKVAQRSHLRHLKRRGKVSPLDDALF